jgi:predicted P-loop ATPase
MKIIKPKINTRQVATGESVIQETVKYIRARYEIKYNPFLNKHTIFQKKGNRTEITPDSLFLIMRSAGFKISEHNLKKILCSDYSEFAVATDVNPVHEYLNSVRGKYNGVSHIDKLAGYLVPRQFAEDNADVLRLQKYFKKWFVAMVATALGLTKNDVMFNLVHSVGGSGKTKFFEFFTEIPQLIFYRKTIAEKTQKIDMQLEATRNLCILFDELSAIKKSYIDAFKSLLSSEEQKVKHRYATHERQLPKLASFGGNTNYNAEKGGFIPMDDMGYMRRIFSVELAERINFRGYTKEILHEQLYSEALLLIENTDYDYNFNEADYIDFYNYNLRYVKAISLTDIIAKHFCKGNGHAHNLTATEITDILISKNYPAKMINPVAVGRTLNLMGFEQKTARVGEEKTPKHPYKIEFIK